MTELTLKFFEGCAIDILESMKKEGYVPLSIAGMMKIKVEEGCDSAWRKNWIDANLRGKKDWERFIDKTGANLLDYEGGEATEEFFPHSVDSSDSYYLHPDGRVKIVRNDKRLRNLSERDILEKRVLLGELFGGNLGLLFPSDKWDSLTGDDVLELTRTRVDEIGWKGYNPEEAKISPEWRFIARNQEILNRYVDFSFPRRFIPSNIPIPPFMELKFHGLRGYPQFHNFLGMSGLGKNSHLLMYPLSLIPSNDCGGISAVACMISKRISRELGCRRDFITYFIGVKEQEREKYFS